MEYQQTLTENYLELNQETKKIEIMKFCIISNSCVFRCKNNLLNFAIEYKP